MFVGCPCFVHCRIERVSNSLLILHTDSLDKLVSKTRLDNTRILSHLHLHSVQWLYHILLIYRIKSRTTTRRTSTYRTHTCP
jgi:hypothetical protein